MKSKSFDTKKFLSQNGIWGVLIVMVILLTIVRPVFISRMNLQTLLESESIKGILAFGIMWAILSKGIDLGPGSVVALVSAVVASLVQQTGVTGRLLGENGLHLSAPLAMLVGLLIGAVVGLITGVIIAYTQIPPFIATLGTQLICRALAKMYTDRPVSNLEDSFRWIAKGKIGPVPMIVVVFIIMYILTAFLLTQTRFGKNVYAIGGNSQAARFAGINVEKNLVMVYIICSVCAALGGILLAARTGSADPSSNGLMYETDAIAAATVGGTSHSGGICRVSGVLCGILILGVINNGLVLLGVDDNMTNVVRGAIIVGAVILDMRKNVKKA
ncbi:ribose/xylose/arabinose/galactoside ABC-type transport system permease subunit [Aequitasia blattaphilus]|uniref:Autoinducer 2 import system permease protein LsrD n=1 Tax=Aequitasia blattaphilus TaxID=2949332 RepID=A0ABT1E723_9FIRM|nr:hypothetical protein [Aequitasia blattaphilus]MCP1101568.1 hypothetical protein [Aequitasia blattaphilus]MCR8614208.1 hypothetical protein [Aequitasia blattaphilus]